MFVLCPHCQFLVTIDPINGQPPAHCPRCHALLQVSSEQTAETQAPVASVPAPLEPEVAVEAGAPAHSDSMDIDDFPAENAAESPVSTATDAPPRVATASKREHKNSLATIGSWLQIASRRRWLRMTIIVVLLAVLVLQSLLADRVQLAADARWRPVISTLCNALGCHIPTWREPAAFKLLDRRVRADPRHPGVLHVTMAFRNGARWRQPWPSLLLTLSDADGRVVGERLFKPSDYLGGRPTQNGVDSGQSASVSLDVVEPAQDAVAFTFELR